MSSSLFSIFIILIIPARSLLAHWLVQKNSTGELQLATERFLLLAFCSTILCIGVDTWDSFLEGGQLPVKGTPVYAITLVSNLIIGFLFAAFPFSIAYGYLREIRSTKIRFLQRALKTNLLTTSITTVYLLFLMSLLSVDASLLLVLAFFFVGAVVGLLHGLLPHARPKEEIADGVIYLDRPFSERWFRNQYKSYPRMLFFIAASYLAATHVFHSVFPCFLPVLGYLMSMCALSFGWFYLYEKRNNVRLRIGYAAPDPPDAVPTISPV